LSTPPQKRDYAKDVVLFATVLFTIIEVLIAAEVINVNNVAFLPPNLQTQEHWYQNPIIWVIGVTLLINFAGYVENVVINKQTYSYSKFVETFYKYLPMIVVFSQAIPNEQGAILAVVLDELRRALKKPA